MKKSDYAKLYTLRPDGRYQGYYRDAAGKRHTVCDRDPVALFHKIEEKQLPPKPTFEQVANEWLHEHVEQLGRNSQATYRAPVQSAIDEFGDMPIEDLSAADIQRVLMAEKAHGYSRKHASTTKSIYKMICDFAIIKKYILINPTAAVTVPRGMKKSIVHAPNEDQEAKFVAGLGGPFGTFAALTYYTGLRTQEIVALQWQDIDLERGVIKIERAADLCGTPIIKSTKTEAGEREVPIMDELRPFLKRPRGAKLTDWVIHDEEGKVLTRGKINTGWRQFCKAAGLAVQEIKEDQHRGKRTCTRTIWVATVKPHQLRHSFATKLYEADIDKLARAAIIGHKDSTTTDKIYTDIRKKHIEEQAKKLQQEFKKSAAK